MGRVREKYKRAESKISVLSFDKRSESVREQIESGEFLTVSLQFS